MLKCNKCGDDFTVPKYAIQMIYAKYCKPCIKDIAKVSAKKIAKMSNGEYLKLVAKQIEL